MSIEQVREFNEVYKVAMNLDPSHPTARVRGASLRYKLIKEEFGELLDAIEVADLTELADALGDIQYVTHGAALVFGLPYIDSVVTDWSTSFDGENILFSEEGQASLLLSLRNLILLNDIEALELVLARILEALTNAAETLKIDLDGVVSDIHTSNLSKLGADGQPIYREGDQKVVKGPNYAPPTTDIERRLYGEI